MKTRKTTLKKLLRSLVENGGFTLKKGKKITHKEGYQVATEGIETTSIDEAVEAIIAYKGNCGAWYSQGIYYIDKSHLVLDKQEALRIGRAHKQISILKWADMSLIYCNEE